MVGGVGDRVDGMLRGRATPSLFYFVVVTLKPKYPSSAVVITMSRHSYGIPLSKFFIVTFPFLAASPVKVSLWTIHNAGCTRTNVTLFTSSHDCNVHENVVDSGFIKSPFFGDMCFKLTLFDAKAKDAHVIRSIAANSIRFIIKPLLLKIYRVNKSILFVIYDPDRF